ncbi:MAG: diaminopimelate decarboxylase [Cyanobacteriota bacterium erpe_2018_sw_21hr_WHONDRS-SW48-000092_B_bin.40]|jgi:diaminopimelate decarboxylase|nr:diaminopimelate decarboxylase [Cyanobacteriota bacterium erpe_2018_sw_21hr_WHONDRS-SW48-000092_B_bin.40]
MISNQIESPNQSIMPTSATINDQNHLCLGGIDTSKLVEEFGSPLWVMCEDSIMQSAAAVKEGLAAYPHALPCYAGKAFLCLAMVRLIGKAGFGLDVVSDGELYTALQANFPSERIFFHGNNKSARELAMALESGVKIVVDSQSELEALVTLAKAQKKSVDILLRIIPGIELDTHDHIKTGHDTSKFGIPLDELDAAIKLILSQSQVRLIGLHAHIGSQAMDLAPYLESVDLFAELYLNIQKKFNLTLPHLDVGGGLGIAYTAADKPLSMQHWARVLSERVKSAFTSRNLPLPELSVEPGRAIVGSAGVTLYSTGHLKQLPGGTNYLAVDGGMADNPRPITYQAQYTAAVANRMKPEAESKNWSIVGRYCESGDIIVEEANLDARDGDLIAIFATGAYNYSMSSNYNRTGRPACVLVKNGHAEVIIERETCRDLVSHDRIPSWLK